MKEQDLASRNPSKLRRERSGSLGFSVVIEILRELIAETTDHELAMLSCSDKKAI